MVWPPVVWPLALASAAAWYAAGPPVHAWPVAFVALVPWLSLTRRTSTGVLRPVFLAAFLFFFACLQGLRHAHVLMIGPCVALAAYLAIYPCLFVAAMRSSETEQWRKIPTPLRAGFIWVGLEWIRNHFLTGISVLMLGHTVIEVPQLIQIADLLGGYGVSFVVVVVNAAVWSLIQRWRFGSTEITTLSTVGNALIGFMVLAATWMYGASQLRVPTSAGGANVLLVGLNERTEYLMDNARSDEIFRAYAAETMRAAAKVDIPIDAIVWPESMFAGNMVWMTAGNNLRVPAGASPPGAPRVTLSQMRDSITQFQRDFETRAAQLQSLITPPGGDCPAIIGGCPLVRYDREIEFYSGIVMVDPGGRVSQTYAKNHLVLFGETIPLVDRIPIVRDWLPPGLGLNVGSGPARFELPHISLLPNICIETAVERIAINHLRVQLKGGQALPDAIVTVTNDAWFNETAVVEHHLRCAQMVAVAARRPILSSANGGPTAWIDSRGIVVDRLAAGQTGTILARPRRDDRVSFVVRYGAIPAGIAGVIMVGWVILNTLWQISPTVSRVRRWRNRRRRPAVDPGARTES